MRISRVKLLNFRQFFGEQELAFPTIGEKNVTLIHAENGFGKTSILNAVLWCLFKQVTPKFERPDDIVNYDAHDAGVKTARVDVEIEFKNQQYLIQRTFNADSDGRDKTKLAAFRREKGRLEPLPAAETFVSTVIPPEMAKYFFFDGEAAESFAAARNFKELGNAIRSILGCSLADTAIADLKELLKHVDREIGETAGDDRIETLEREIARLRTELETAASLREHKIEEITTLKEQHEEIVRSLRDAAGAQEIQKQRDTKLETKQNVETEIATTRVDVLKWIGQRSVSVVSRRLSQVAFDFVDEESLRGRIPSPYNKDFVKGLLQSATCVCHRPLNAGTPEWAAVAELLNTASNAEAMNRIVRARARSQMLRTDAADAPITLASHQSRLAHLSSQLTRLEQEIEDLGKKIEGLPLAELANRERARSQVWAKLERSQQDLGAVKGHIVQLESQRERLDKDLEDLARRNKRTVRLYAKRRLVMMAIQKLWALLDSYEGDARRRIESQVTEILEEVAHKDYHCRFNANFGIELILNDKATPKSAGENQLLSLAFIAALVRFAADRVDADDLILKPGIVAPLVLDAPLGQLDPAYQESVAQFLPKLAQQVVLLVSGSQGGDHVLEALESRVSAEYLLVQENKGARGKKQVLKRVIRGHERDLVLFGREHTMTHIERLA